MDSLLEIKEYCNLKNPVGALLLTGEWGCGKTYLIDHSLKKDLDSTHVIIRISLFGISTVDELHNSVKKAWIQAKGGILNAVAFLGKLKTVAGKATEAVGNTTAKGIAQAALSINNLTLLLLKTE